MTGTQDQFIPGIYRQHILAGIIIAGHQPVQIDTHGGGPGAAGSHLTATFGNQLMITLYDTVAANLYTQAWLDDADQWIYNCLPAEIPVVHGQGRAASGPRSASGHTAMTAGTPGTTPRRGPRSSGSGRSPGPFRTGPRPTRCARPGGTSPNSSRSSWAGRHPSAGTANRTQPRGRQVGAAPVHRWS